MKNRGGNPVRWLDSLRSAFEKKATQLTYDQIANLIDGGASRVVAGVNVNAETALHVSTVLACVKVIADGCATPALNIYRETAEKRRERAINIPEYRLLHRRPNEWQTSYEWRRMMTLHAALTGSGLSLKVRGANRRLQELIPIMPGRWDVRRIARYEVRYRLWDDWGFIGEFNSEDVFHLQNVQWDYINAMDAVALARQAIGLAIATEQSHAAFHANGVRPSGIYSVDGTLTADQHQRLMDVLASRAGSSNAGKPMVMDRNAKFQPTSMTGIDAQHLETRRMQVEEICRAFGVFPIMIGHSDKSATFASSEAFFAAHLKHTLRPWHEAWTQRIDEMLLDGTGPLWAEFDTRYMQAGSMVDRAQWARTMAELGIYTRNELRDEEGKDPLPGLDEPLTPMNMGGAPAEDADDPADGADTAPN
jgi:HK97 family phage portal protein